MNRELKAVLEVYTRKIRTFIDTQISRINTNLRVAYEHLVSRTSKYPVNYDIADRTIWDSEHLLTALTAFSARKISNGSAPSDGIPDGTSLAHLLCDGSDVVEIKDDNSWGKLSQTSSKTLNHLWTFFPNLKKLSIGCNELSVRTYHTSPITDNSKIEELEFTNCETIEEGDRGIAYNCQNLTSIKFPKLKTLYSGWFTNHNCDGLVVNCNAVEEVELPELTKFENRQSSGSYNCVMYNDAGLKKLKMPKLSDMYSNNSGTRFLVCLCPAIEELEVGKLTRQENVDFVDSNCASLGKIILGQDTMCNVNLRYWNPTDKGTTFLQNFREHIALRLTANGSGLTLTLSAAVYNAVTGADSGWASIHTLADLGITAADLTALETDLGITPATLYASWLDTYRAAINWNYAKA